VYKIQSEVHISYCGISWPRKVIVRVNLTRITPVTMTSKFLGVPCKQKSSNDFQGYSPELTTVPVVDDYTYLSGQK